MIDLDHKLSEEECGRIVARKIPVSSGWGCGFGGPIMAMVTTSPIASIDQHSLMPTDRELLQLRSFIEFYVRSYYNETWTQKLLSAPVAADEGSNTYLFYKGADGWRYRRKTWDIGPSWVPERGQSLPHILTLTCFCCGEPSLKWSKWILEHADLFDPAEIDKAAVEIRAGRAKKK